MGSAKRGGWFLAYTAGMTTRDTLRAPVLMSRPAILLSALPAFGLGAAMAFAATGALPWPSALAALAISLLANLAAHFAVEYADADTDALARPTGVSGGSGAMAAGPATPPLALRLGRDRLPLGGPAAMVALFLAQGVGDTLFKGATG